MNRFTQAPRCFPDYQLLPGMGRFYGKNTSDFKDNFSTCKSPQAMVGALTKPTMHKNADRCWQDVYGSIMSCNAKKYETSFQRNVCTGHQDIDISITARELAQRIKQAGDFVNLPEEPDHILRSTAVPLPSSVLLVE